MQTSSHINHAHSKNNDVFVLGFMNCTDTIARSFADLAGLFEEHAPPPDAVLGPTEYRSIASRRYYGFILVRFVPNSGPG